MILETMQTLVLRPTLGICTSEFFEIVQLEQRHQQRSSMGALEGHIALAQGP